MGWQKCLRVRVSSLGRGSELVVRWGCGFRTAMLRAWRPSDAVGPSGRRTGSEDQERKAWRYRNSTKEFTWLECVKGKGELFLRRRRRDREGEPFKFVYVSPLSFSSLSLLGACQ